MEGKFLVDSDFLIALYNERDSNHRRALTLIEHLASIGDAQLYFSVFVYGETTTILAQRVSQKTAHYFMDDIQKHGLSVITNVADIFLEAQNIFRKQQSKNVSFVDATNIALMRGTAFAGLLSFDQDYAKNGIRPFKG